MSLITETLKKMKKENSPENNRDDEVLAPPALRNAIVNTKKYIHYINLFIVLFHYNNFVLLV